MKLGLVLAGGGGKGAYEIGVWRAIRELGLEEHIGAVSGTSVGALNAMLFYNGNLELAETLWKNISPQALMPDGAAGESSAGQAGLSGMIDAVLCGDDDTRNMICCVACKRVRDGAVKYFEVSSLSPELQRKALLASSALPGIFPPVEIGEQLYSDGGIDGDNVPVRPLYDRGIRTAIVVQLKTEAEAEEEKEYIGEWPGMEIIRLTPSRSLGGYEDGTLDFRPESAAWRRELGLQDARAALAGLAERMKSKS